MKRLRIAITALIMLTILAISTVSKAFILYYEDAQSIIKDHEFFPSDLEGKTFFCIGADLEFRPSGFIKRAEDPFRTGGALYIPGDEAYVCEECNPTLDDLVPWGHNEKYYYEYEEAGKISYMENQDAAYVLAEMTERGALRSWDSAYGIWSSGISNPKRSGGYEIIGESKAYKTFFESIRRCFRQF